MKISSQQKKILIIKFGGLGDIVLSLDAMFSIIEHHKTSVALLTEKPFDEFLEKSKWFNRIFTIRRSFLYFNDLIQIKRTVNCSEFDYVYDLQTSKRSSYYLKLFNKEKAVTNGIGKYAKICHSNKNRNNMHTLHRQRDQISLTNVKPLKEINFSWVFKSNYDVPKKKFIMVVPGGSRKRTNKRIPYQIYFKLIKYLNDKKFHVLLIGSEDDEKICQRLKNDFPESENLCKKINLFDIGKLSKFTSLAIGNDTGPMHLISKGGKDTFVFFTKFSDPKLCMPVGKKVTTFKFTGNSEFFFDNILLKIKNSLSFE
tara:strand:- start:371 stop:1309 length:939 start_codon:yes stop_codon:yes gene_type:complete